MLRHIILPLSAALFMAGCVTTSQYTSGKDYLKTYDHPAYKAAPGSVSTIDQEVRAIAAIEPRLFFPARIGLARIENGQLRAVPEDEALSWRDLTSGAGENYGEFVPVSPLIAAMVNAPRPEETGAARVVNQIRRAGARQHLDYVLIYEVQDKTERQSNGLRLADLSILGLYVLPSRDVKVEATASALLIDVRNGYPYGSASAYAEKTKAATLAGSRKATARLSERARVVAVDNLVDEVETFMAQLKQKSAEMNDEAGN